jgi:hypothetical protein
MPECGPPVNCSSVALSIVSPAKVRLFEMDTQHQPAITVMEQ